MNANAKVIRDRRKSMGLTQRELAAKAGLSIRAIKNAEAGKSIGLRTARELAQALRAEVVQLVFKEGKLPVVVECPKFLKQQLFPAEIDNILLTKLHDAALADMRGDYASAEKVLKELKSNPTNKAGKKIEIIVKLATVHDNAGKSKEAIEELSRVLKSFEALQLPSEIFDWIRYHIALAQRRLAENRTPLDLKVLNHAESLFTRVHNSTGDAHQHTACKHQLGVISWLKSQQPVETIKRSTAEKDRNLARNYFSQAAERWRKCENFREGYSLRRLAALSFSEGKPIKAVELLLDSLEIFSRHGCDKYRNEVRAQLLKAFSQAV